MIYNYIFNDCAVSNMFGIESQSCAGVWMLFGITLGTCQ